MIKKLKNKLDEDLGFGSQVIQENQLRFINKDGSLNVRKKHVSFGPNSSLYHAVINTTWPRFFMVVVVIYFAINSVFTLLYLAAGPEAFPTIANLNVFSRAEELFFYSIQILTTLGSSPIQPKNLMSHMLLSLEAMIGMIGFSLGAGLIFARFSHPSMKIIYSKKALVGPYEKNEAFMFRIINAKNNDLIDVEVSLTLSMLDKKQKRSFHRLPLERKSISSFPLSWTVVHPITEESPLYHLTAEDLEKGNAEFLINVSATDMELAKEMHSRFSYLYNEIVFGAKFAYIIEHEPDGTVVVDPKRIHEIEKL